MNGSGADFGEFSFQRQVVQVVGHFAYNLYSVGLISFRFHIPKTSAIRLFPFSQFLIFPN